MLTPSEVCDLLISSLIKTAIILFIAGCIIGGIVTDLLHFLTRT